MAGWALPEGGRQGVAAALASFGFLGLYFVAGLAWWLSLLLAILVYAGLLLLIRRKRSAVEILVADPATAAQIEEAGRALGTAVVRLRKAADAAPEAEQGVIDRMAERVASIRAQILTDPADYDRVRRFVGFFLPAIVGSVESFAALASETGSSQTERLATLATRIRGFLPVIERIDDACRENDFSALEVEVAVLDEQLARFRGAPK